MLLADGIKKALNANAILKRKVKIIMNSINKDKYDTYYNDEDQKWRKICSKYKAEMIAKL